MPLPDGIVNGDLIRSPNEDPIYFIEAEQRRWIPDMHTLAVNWPSTPVKIIPSEVINSIPRGADIPRVVEHQPGTDAMSDDGLAIGIDTAIRDEPGARVRFRVEAADDPNVIEMRLEIADSITWWKSVSYFQRVGSQDIERYRIECKDGTKSAEQLINPAEISEFGRFELWKGGFLGFGAQVQTMQFNARANRGRRFVFSWISDR